MKFLSSFSDKIIRFFSLFLISAILVIVPLKILSYGWAPHYAMLISATLTKNGDFPLSKEGIRKGISSNTPIYDVEKERNLIYIVFITFILFNIVGICCSPKEIAWFVAMSLIMLTNGNFIIRLLNSSPQILICILLMIVIALFYRNIKENSKLSMILLLLYIYMLRSVIPPEIYAIDIINVNYKYYMSQQLKDLLPLIIENCWLFFVPFIMWLSAYKKKSKIIQEFDDALLFVVLFLQLFINLGYNDLILYRDTILLMWLTYKFSEIINNILCFKELRIKYSMGIYVLLLFFFLSTHDGLGRYSKNAIETMPIDFNRTELVDWVPESGGIFFNDNVDFVFSQYYWNPNVKYSYFYPNSFLISEKEKENILNIKRMIDNKETPLPDYYREWVDQMRPIDRLITSKKINGLEKIEWLQCGRKIWIGRLKNN